ncbi:unnamed protein product [Amoebophrya sp. A120]|nr:unnamed protein product [Amoebophrya sp. A120]|eukprot:GSA120T00003031001.1
MDAVMSTASVADLLGSLRDEHLFPADGQPRTLLWAVLSVAMLVSAVVQQLSSTGKKTAAAAGKTPKEKKELYFTEDKRQWLFSLQDSEKAKPKMVYDKRDFYDYVIMLALSIGSCVAVYGVQHVLTKIVFHSSWFLLFVFATRHGTCGLLDWLKQRPAIFSPRVWLHWAMYKTENMRPSYCYQIAVFAGDIVLLRVLRTYVFTKSYPSEGDDDEMFSSLFSTPWSYYAFYGLTFGLFYLSFAVATVLRTVSLLDHLYQHNHVFKFLQQTGWRKTLRFLPEKLNLPDVCDHFVGLLHAFVTGVWTHVVTVIPYYLVLCAYWTALCSPAAPTGSSTGNEASGTSSTSSDQLLPHPGLVLTAVLSWLLRFLIIEQRLLQMFEQNDLNDWYIRDHWLGHFSKIGFSYMHGPHHDCLPVGFIAVADNGPLEGMVRHFFGHFDSFCCPPFACFRWTKTIIRDIVGHQYVPGVLPWSFSVVDYGVHHVEHHYLSMYPLGNGIEHDPDPRNNLEVENWLSNGAYGKSSTVWTWFVSEVQRIESGKKNGAGENKTADTAGAEAAGEDSGLKNKTQ